jgi:hypothetical protein
MVLDSTVRVAVKWGDALWIRKRLKNTGFGAEFGSDMAEPFLFIGGKLTGRSQAHPRNRFEHQRLKGRIVMLGIVMLFRLERAGPMTSLFPGGDDQVLW